MLIALLVVFRINLISFNTSIHKCGDGHSNMLSTVELQLFTEDPLLHSVLLLSQCYQKVLNPDFVLNFNL